MNTIKLMFFTLALGVFLNGGVAQASGKDIHSLEPKRGGIVSESNHMEFELVVKPDATELYASDHGQAVDFSNASAKITLLEGGQKTEKVLAGSKTMLKGEGFALKSTAYTALATVTFSNKKSMTVRFKSK